MSFARLRLPYERPNPVAAMLLAFEVRGMAARQYMVVEKYKDAAEVYRRFGERGRMAPEGLRYISSWVDEKVERCFQLMETADRRLLDEWMANWRDLVEFEVYPVISSKEAAEKAARRSPR